MDWLNYHHLYYFKVIATEGGIAKAAEKLRLGQPTLSAQLRQLEDSVGRPLFERKNRKMVLTEAGKSALEYANEIFKLGQEMMEVLQDINVHDQVHLQIGALDSVPKSMILALTLQAYELSPLCTVSLLEGKGDELFRELTSHKLDLILSNYPPPVSEQRQIFSRSVARPPVSIYGVSKFRGLKKSFPHSLHGRPLVLPTAHSRLRHDLNHYFRLHNIHIHPVAETQDTGLQKIFAKNGLGLAPLSVVEKEDQLGDNGLHHIGTLEGIYEEVWLISAQRKLENPVAAKLFKTFSL